MRDLRGRVRTFVEGRWSLWMLHGMSHGVAEVVDGKPECRV